MEDINYNLTQDSVELFLPTKNKGKFRWKNRVDNSKYGSGFATATNSFSDESYIEWQIGYDSEIGHEKKKTILNDLKFIGANGKSKNPYELSEILFLLKKINLITKDELTDLLNEIEERDFSFDDEYKIQTSDKKTVKISDFEFHQQDIILPTFSYYDSGKGLCIEISIQKQQYATGVQPMVYFSIPIQCFDNSNELIGKTSKSTGQAKLVIDKDNKHFILNLFKFFGMCSSKHKHDVLCILKLLIKE